MSVDSSPARSRYAEWPRRIARVAAVFLSAIALVLGLAPAATAQSGSVRIDDFTFTATVNAGQSDLRPGGHVRLDLTATNTHGSGWGVLSNRVLNTYGFTVPSGYTLRSSGGNDMTNVGTHGQNSYFGGQPGGVTSPNRSVPKDDSRSGWLSFNIPVNAQGGSVHQFGVRAHLGTNGDWRPTASNVVRFTMPAVGTSTAMTVSPSVARAGEETTLTARVSASAGSNIPAGKVNFTVGGQSLSGTVSNGVATVTTTFDAAGNLPVTASFQPANTVQWRTSTTSGTVRVQTEATQTDVTLDPVEILAGRAVQASASVTPAGAEGEIVFSAGETTLRVLVTADGTATAELPADTSGPMTVTATFVPANPERYSSSTDSQTVDVYEQTSTSTSLTASEPVEAGRGVVLTSIVTPQTADGTVTFTIGGQAYPATVTNGTATLDHTFPTAGRYTVVADFTPTNSDRYTASTAELTVTVQTQATQTDLTLDPVEVTAGGDVTATARITPADVDGTVRFDYGDQTQTVDVADGQSSATFTALNAGTGTITATFIPANPERFAESSDTQAVEITAESTVTDLTLDTVEVTAGGVVRASATVTPAGAAGTITFTAGEYSASVPVAADGTTTADLPVGTAGQLTVTVTFVPANADRYTESSDAQSIEVDAEPTRTAVTVNADPARVGEQSTFTATVTPTGATGTVTFTIDDQEFTATVIDGAATVQHIFTTTGQHPVTAAFAPADNGRYSGSSDQATVNVEVESTRTELMLDPVEITAGGDVVATAQVTPVDAEGSVRFDYGGQTRTVAVTDGQAAATFTAETAGTGTVTATFLPADPNRYTESSDSRSVDVAAETTWTEVTVDAAAVRLGDEAIILASITPAGAAGTVTFTIDGEESTTEVTNGSATLTHTFATAGERVVVARFTPVDTDRYSSSTGRLTVDVGEVAAVVEPTSLELEAGTAKPGEEVTLTATVTPASAAGRVRFTIDGQEHLVPVVNGVATLTHIAGARGSYTVRAEFVPADLEAYAPSGATVTLTVIDETVTDPGTDPGVPTTGWLGLVGLVASFALVLGSAGALGPLGS